jgi:RNA polymerase sigma-70 factor (ECF subfamily)
MAALAFSHHGKARTEGRAAVGLVERARRGSRPAFAALWQTYGPTVHAILLTMVADDDADDLAQEVAVAAMRSIASLRRSEDFPAWLGSIARNIGRSVSAQQSKVVPFASVGDAAAPAAGNPIRAEAILSQIRSLPGCCREVVVLRLLLELSGPEIAAHSGMAEGSVRVHLHRGMALLRQRFPGAGVARLATALAAKRERVRALAQQGPWCARWLLAAAAFAVVAAVLVWVSILAIEGGRAGADRGPAPIKARAGSSR